VKVGGKLKPRELCRADRSGHQDAVAKVCPASTAPGHTPFRQDIREPFVGACDFRCRSAAKVASTAREKAAIDLFKCAYDARGSATVAARRSALADRALQCPLIPAETLKQLGGVFPGPTRVVSVFDQFVPVLDKATVTNTE